MKVFYMGRHEAEPKNKGRRRAGTLLPVVLAFMLVSGGVALADNLFVDSDDLAPVANSATMNLGDICPGSSATDKALLAIQRSGSGQVYANNAAVTVTAGAPIGDAGVTTVMLDDSITLPSDWVTIANTTMSVDTARVSVAVEGSVTSGSKSSTVALSASGNRNTGGSLTRTQELTINWNVLPATHASCAPPPPPNQPPSVDAGGSYEGDEGSSVSLSGTASDADSDPLTYSWSYAAGAGVHPDATCVFSNETVLNPTITCDDDGTFELTLTVDDGVNPPVSDTAALEVANVAPSITTLNFQASSASCGADNASLTFEFADEGENDTHTLSVDWGDGDVEELTESPASHTYETAGKYSATLTVTDDDGGSDIQDTMITINYTIVGGGVQPPIKSDGTSVFKFGSTVPVKAKVEDCDGSYPSNLFPQIRYQKVSGATPGGLAEPASTSAADTAGVMRFTGAPDHQYIYNLATKSLPDSTATYRVVITIPSTGQVIQSANWGVK